MKRKLWFVLFSILLVGVLLLSACATPAPSAPSAPPAPTKAPTAEPQRGGVLVISRPAGPASLGNTPTMRGPDYFYGTPALEMFLDQNEEGRPVAKLATDWKVDPNGKFVTFTLRKGVKFHDGTDWNAEAAKYNLDAIIKGKVADLVGVTSVDVIDEYTVRMNTEYFSDTMMANLSVPISSPAWLAKGEDVTKFNPVGTGPFKFVEFKRDVSIKYTKFDNYWDKGKPYLDGIEFRFIPDAMTASAAFQAGEIQMFDAPSIPVAVDLRTKGYTLLTTYGGKTALAPDTANPGSIFADIRVREAIEYAIDREGIAKTLGQGLLIPASQLDPVGSPAYNPDVGRGRVYNPDKAKQLLKDAGFPNGFKTTIICSTMYSIPDVMTAIQSYLAAVGIEAKLDYADPGRWTEIRTRSGWKDALLFTHNGFFANVPRSMVFIFSKKRGDNVSMARPTGCEELLQQILSTQDFQAQKALMQKMSKLLYDQAMYVPLYYPVNISITQKNVHDTERHSKGQLVQWTPQNAWFSK